MEFNINGHTVIVDDDDAHLATSFKWRVREYSGGNFRACYNLQNNGTQKTLFLHRQICQPPECMVVDHINGNSLDNRRANLRICTQAENLRNKRAYANNKTGLKGVHRVSSNSYRAMISVDKNSIDLGCYPTPEQAHNAYQHASLKYHGQFGRSA
jgi:hypothetical protein